MRSRSFIIFINISKRSTTRRRPLTVCSPRLVRLSQHNHFYYYYYYYCYLSLSLSFVFELKMGELYHNVFCNSLYPGLAQFQQETA